jgi:hypothetical protein
VHATGRCAIVGPRHPRCSPPPNGPRNSRRSSLAARRPLLLNAARDIDDELAAFVTRAWTARVASQPDEDRTSLRLARRETLRGLRIEPAADALERNALASKLDGQSLGCL